tara:strand:- start:23972 stop:24448 length:477 start_codon:yes stop_codon:yes gene_type:complete
MAGRKKNKYTPPAHAPEWTLLFLQTLGATGNVTAACKAADISRKTVYNHRDKYPQFAEAWDGSMEEALDKLEGTLWKLGADGNTRAIELVLKARRPMFREGHKAEVTVNNTNVTLVDGQDPLELLKSRMSDMRERMIEGEVIEVEAKEVEEEHVESST